MSTKLQQFRTLFEQSVILFSDSLLSFLHVLARLCWVNQQQMCGIDCSMFVGKLGGSFLFGGSVGHGRICTKGLQLVLSAGIH